MPNFIPECSWAFHCGPQKDYDFDANWGNVTIQRDNLRYVKVTSTSTIRSMVGHLDQRHTRLQILQHPIPLILILIFTMAGVKSRPLVTMKII